MTSVSAPAISAGAMSPCPACSWRMPAPARSAAPGRSLLARNLAILNRLYPGYDTLIANFREADPLAQARFRMDALRWRQDARARAR